MNLIAAAGLVPVPQDYDADGKADPAVFRPATAEWTILQSVNNQRRTFRLGARNDVPVPSPYTPYRVPPAGNRAAANNRGGGGQRIASASIVGILPDANLANAFAQPKKRPKGR